MKRKIIPGLLVILLMGLIFHLSHQPVNKSRELSGGITEIIVDQVEKVAPDMNINKKKFNHLLRKNEHFFTYLILGVLVVSAIRSFRITGYRAMGLALLICIIFAISDEVHQLFVPGRGGQIKDVIIDSAGAFVGITGYNLILSRIKS